MKAAPRMTRINRPVEMRSVPGYRGLYSITRDGRIWSHGRTDRFGTVYEPRWLRLVRVGRNLAVTLSNKDHRHTNHYIPYLVMAAWGTRPPSPDHVISHRDSDRSNNTLENLQWVKPAARPRYPLAGPVQPVDDGQRRGPRGKLTKAQILEIRARYTGEYGQLSELGREFGVSRVHIYDIVNRRSWAHI